MKTSAPFKMRIIFLITSLFSTIGLNAQWGSKTIKGNGKTTTVFRTTTDYNAIICTGALDYILVYGTEGQITIEGEDNLLKYIVTEVKHNNLVVKIENKVSLKPSTNKDIKVTIPCKDIEKISLTGSGDLWNEGILNNNKLDVSLTGSGDVTLNIKTNYAKSKVTGSGDISLKGDTDELESQVTGSGNFHGFDLKSKNTKVTVTGSGDAEVSCTEILKASVAGSGDIVYKGSPKIEETKIAGSGSISSL
ncbi:MAG: head GIN domain-containing protein [Flavobacteriaceae bacterium]